MKRMFWILIASAAVTSASAQAPETSPLLGSWALDVERSEIPVAARPKGVTITYSDAGAGKWRSNVDIVGGDGRKISAAGTYPLDGTAAPSQGYANVDTVAASVPTPSVMVMAFYKEGMPRNTRTYTVAADGKTMTETIVWLNLNGKPEITTNRFTRVQ